MNIKTMNIQDLESYFNLTVKMRDSVIMMARANNNLNTPKVRKINERYNLLLSEIMSRLDSLENKTIENNETNEKVAK